jgi:CheY-like chemotaxis protein
MDSNLITQGAAVKKVLVVDDEQPLARVLTAIVKLMGCETFTAFNGQQGLDMAREHHPDLILTDYMMPTLTGAQLIEHVSDESQREGWSSPASIILTCVDREQIGDCQADVFLSKPFDLDELKQVVTHLLDLDVS